MTKMAWWSLALAGVTALTGCGKTSDDEGDTDTDVADTEVGDTEVEDTEVDTEVPADSDTDVAADDSFTGTYGWTCEVGVDCQDVFDVPLPTGAVVTFRVSDVTGGSVSQLALYAPSVALGGENLFTESVAELRCGAIESCDDGAAGQVVEGFTVPEAGTYRLAVTRDWGVSCGGGGEYQLTITSTLPFTSAVAQTVEDAASAADGVECPIM